MDATEKRETYRQIVAQLQEVLRGLDDEIAAMASCAALLKENVPYASWAGFYRRVEPRLLRVGPYQGPLGCLEVTWDRGVCGAAAREKRTQLVPDVDAFAGHIACDPRARSEVAVPIVGADGEVTAVLDLDSHEPGAFDETDVAGLEEIARILAPGPA
jgi:GAF domain-containing protein